MSTFEDNQYRWRETYFVLFDVKKWPKLKTLAKAIEAINPRYELKNARADEHGRIESLTVVSPDDFASLDICYTSGDEVLEQGAALIEELKKFASDTGVEIPLQKILSANAQFDVLHFEHVSDPSEEEEDDMLDPGALLVVLEALAKITEGVAIDPQSGTVICED